MGLEGLLILLGLILANGVFSMAEIAIVSARKSRLEALAKKGDKKAKTTLALASDHTRFLSTVQVGITLISVLTGAIGGSELSDSFQNYLVEINLLTVYWAKPVALGLVVLMITYFSIILGELVPKRLGLHNPEAVGRAMAPTMLVVSKIFSPLVWVLSSSTNLLVKAFRLKESDEPLITEEEIKELINQGTNTGEFEEVEQDIIERVFHLGDRKIASLMTSQLDVEWLDSKNNFDVNRQKILSGVFSHFPVCDGDLDKVIGILGTKKFLIANHNSKGKPFDIVPIMDPPMFIPENMTAFKVLEAFKVQKKRLAIVIDEYGAVQGIVTMHDLVEALVGDMDQPETQEEAQIIKRDDGTYLIDALLSFEEFIQHFDLEDVEQEDRTGFHTLGGFILHLNEQIPRTGEIFVWRNFSFEVIDMDGNRIDKILVSVKQDADDLDDEE